MTFPVYLLVQGCNFESTFGPVPEFVSVDVGGRTSTVVFFDIACAKAYRQSAHCDVQIATFCDPEDFAEFISLHAQRSECPYLCANPSANDGTSGQLMTVREVLSWIEEFGSSRSAS